ncbi:mitochondrial iron uptake protein [Ophiocordyceps camponoti-floridani]|uniref:ferroxidase n=1 Tax=Ophiocordyceps camponoti-floridani TaxID=2030778 RepID=A0A8H4VC80_9HYPO|nr:mitochondrial iron uptake protein [Ophiocordyceps camponoti-floridani]
MSRNNLPRLISRAAASFSRRGGLPSARLGLVVPRRWLVVPTPARRRGIMPHSENPSKAEVAKSEPSYGVLALSDNEYHELADAYLDAVLAKFEQLQDTREDVDVEFSAGVMTITVAGRGTYVINKQPPNRQIWLSSPISGPKRFDWCIVGEGQGEKEGTGSGSWIYTREGVGLNDLILDELEVDVAGPAQTSSVLTR